MNQLKKCKHCQSEIDKKARICPVCKKKQGGKLKFIIIGIIVLVILAAALGGGSDDGSTDVTTSNNTDKAAVDNSSKKDTAKPTEKPIEYTAYDVSELMNDLESNALKAEKKYTDQYIELTGRLGTIDSDGKYISLMPSDDEYAFIGVQCYIKSDEQTDKILEMSTGDTVTLKGKIKSIGEVLGYSLDIIEIK
jgi:hypothetical protein